MSDGGTPFTPVERLEEEVVGLEELWEEYGAEYGDRLMEASAELEEARRGN